MDIRRFMDQSEDLLTDVLNQVHEHTRNRYLRCLISYELPTYRYCLTKRWVLEQNERLNGGC